MTKVKEIMIKCDKCGKESKQLAIYSINFLLGNKESNENLKKHIQKCPYCNYEAPSIGKKVEIKEDI